MGLIREFRERRLYAYLGAYLVTGFVALEGVDQLISYDILPAVAYPIALTWYLFGIVGSLIFAWFHGEKGRQETTKAEMAMHGTLALLALATSTYIFTSTRAAEEMAAAAASSGLDASSLAVLYFDDLSAGGELDYVADGITEALIDRLSEVRSLDVISRNGVQPFRGADITVDSIARALDVGSVIRGSVEQTGEKLRVTARLVDGFSGADIERTTLEMAEGDFLAARDSVAESVSRLLRQRLGEEVQLRQRQASTANVEAWSLAQRAERLRKEAEEAQEQGETDRAIAALAQADSLLGVAEAADSPWAELPAQRAHLASRRAFFVAVSTGDFEAAAGNIETGLEHADRALALDPKDANALEQQGTLKYILYQLDLTPDRTEAERLLAEAQTALEASVEADPQRASAYSLLSHLFYNRADRVSVVLMSRRAYEEDAYLRDADRILERLFWAHYDMEQFRDANTWCEEGGRRFPDFYAFAECRLWLMVSSAEPVSVDSAWTLQARLDSTAPTAAQKAKGQILVAGVLRNAGLPDSAENVFARGRLGEDVDPLLESVAFEAAIRSVTGDSDGAIELLRRYLAANPTADFGVEGGLHWWWRDLQGRPEFDALLRQSS
jgi:TolB-like protein